MAITYAQKFTPLTLPPVALDDYLARGWYRMGGSIFTTHFLFFQGKPYSAIWIRLDLDDFKFSKSQRKLLRKNGTIFNVAFAPRTIDEEREEVYQEYAEHFDGRLSPSIADSLEDYEIDSVFNTYETTVRTRQTDKLVAASYYDVGEESAASILGFYLPHMSGFSLGYYTMLLEIQFCLERGIRYYYPGYVVPGYERFDYKMRLGASQFYDMRTNGWHPLDRDEVWPNAPAERQLRRLRGLARRLEDNLGRPFEVQTYPLFEAGLYDVWADDYLPYPYLMPVMVLNDESLYCVCYDPRNELLLLLHCAHRRQTQLMFNAQYLQHSSDRDFFTDLLAIRRVLLATEDTEKMASACQLVLKIQL